MNMEHEVEKTYLGVDFSTQQLKGIIVDDNLNVLFEEIVQFDRDLPEFRTSKGVLQSSDRLTVTSPTIMWIKAFDILLDKLQVAGADFGRLSAVSGCGQQHGTVYWQKGAEEVLKNLDPSNFLHAQLASSFSVPNSPTWMDSSTVKYCKILEEAVGGHEELAKITGSIAYERFSGSQIAKIADQKRSAYDNTERISLVSSFAPSLLLGKYAEIDLSDGSGMNLLNIRKKIWDDTCLQACAPHLADKLGNPVPSDTDLGPISEYYVERFAFNPNCRIVAFTGDNSSSLIGMRIGSEDVAVSLGTSDTLFLWMDQPKLLLEGHIFINPLDSNYYMGLLCFKNGSITRERFRDRCPNKTWEEFGTILEKSPRGNFGNIGLYFDFEEIIPKIQGEFRFDKKNMPVNKFGSLETEIRSVVEGQFIARRAHAEDFGFKVGRNTKVIVTGGGSQNRPILQVISNIFNASVYVLQDINSAALGGAYLAKLGIRNKTVNENPIKYFDETVSSLSKPMLMCEPYSDANQIYTPMVARYRELIKTVIKA